MRLPRRRPALPERIAPALQAEIDSGLAWMYPWQLTASTSVPIMEKELPSVHRTRTELMEPVVRQWLKDAGPDARALDIACHEGWFAHRLLEWGAGEVVAIDVRDVNVRRATLLRDHYDIPSTSLRFEQASVYDLTPQQLGTFDVVLMIGLIYHLENPIGAIRVARSMSRGLCVVESQLTRQDEPIRTGWGITDQYSEEPASWAARYEPPEEQATQPLAAYGGVISLIPNEAALLQSMRVAGFEQVHMPQTGDGHNVQYRTGDRGLVVGH
jgi:tRNA (mo5U34)-methyltransferase